MNSCVYVLRTLSECRFVNLPRTMYACHRRLSSCHCSFLAIDKSMACGVLINKQSTNERASELMNEWMNVSLFYVRSHELGFLFRFLWSLITARSTKSSTMPIKNEKKKKRHVLQQRSFSMRRVSFHLRNIRRNKKSDDKQTTNNSNRNIYTDCDAHQNRLVELVSFISRNDDDYYCLCLHKIQIIHSKWIHSCWCERVLDVPKQIK